MFFYDRSADMPDDPLLLQLMQLPNQAFATNEALNNIAETTCPNISCWVKGAACENEL